MAVDPEGFAHIIWTSTSGGELLYTSNSSGEFSPVQTLSPQHAGSYSISMDAWDSSHVCFAHQENPSGDMEVMHITDAQYSTRPRITAVSPPAAARGETLDIEITGINTHFEDGVSQATFSGEGITVNSTTVIDATNAVANITVEPDAPPGPRNVNVITGGETPARLARHLALYPAMIEVSSSVTNLTENLVSQGATADSVAVTGDLDGTMSLSFEAVRIGSGPFKGRGFFKGQWEATLETAPYAGDWRGTLNLDEGKGTITMKGTFSGQLGGIMEAVISESTPGSGSYDSYQATWKVSRAGSSSTYAVLLQEGEMGWTADTSHPAVGIRTLQGSFSGEGVAGEEILPMSAVLTHLEVSEEASPYNGEGFSFISYSTQAGAGEIVTYDKVVLPGKLELTGVSSRPFVGTASGTLYDTRAPKMLVMSIDRIDSTLEPAPDLAVKMVMPGQVSPWQEVTYLIECSNDGLVTAEDVQVVQVISDATKVTYLRSTGDAYYDEFGIITLVWNLGDIQPRQAKSVSSLFRVKEGQEQGAQIITVAYIPKTNKQLPPKLEKMEVVSVLDTDDQFIGEAYLENATGEEEVRIELEILDMTEPPDDAYYEKEETDTGYTLEFVGYLKISGDLAAELDRDRDCVLKYGFSSTFQGNGPGLNNVSPMESLSSNRFSTEEILRDLEQKLQQ
ncbi:MAG: hypothetical protein L6427_12610, partial [Actinomycetia bacterium]|nr:hypothetical protein [Actinomycetes bacterium]